MWTDITFLFFLLLFLWRGASRGFLRSLLGPTAFLAATAIALAYYSANKNIPVALSIGLLGPFILYWLGVFFLRSFNSLSKNEKPSVLSRLCGAAVTVLWGMIILLPIIFLLTFLPPLHTAISAMNKDIRGSCTFILLKPLQRHWHLLPAGSGAASSSQENVPSVSLQTLTQDERIQKILNDPQIVQAVEGKNYAALLANPKLLEIAQDPQLMKKILAAYGQIAGDSSSNNNIDLR